MQVMSVFRTISVNVLFVKVVIKALFFKEGGTVYRDR